MLQLSTLILQIIVILMVSRVIGAVFCLIRQPRVVGEMFAGILLGPSLLGRLAPEVTAFLFPPSSLGYLNALSQVGLIIFMFLVGMGINTEELKSQRHFTVLTSHVSIVVPFVLGASLSLYLYPRLSDSSVSFTNFGLFMGTAMSITAFPVLARILTERNMLRTRLGTAAIACAAVDDVTGWCILAYVVLLIRATASSISIWITMVGMSAFTLVMIYVGRHLLRRFGTIYRERGVLSENGIAAILILVLISALFTEWLGVHLLFGAFLMGTIMPKDEMFVRYIHDRFETVSVTLLLPLFFAFTGLRMSVALIESEEMWLYCGLITIAAIAGKLGGSMVAAWFAGLPLREAAGLGLLMNTRGLMELVVLNIGLDVKVISPTLFSMMVMMALLTTFMTTPLLGLVCPDEMIRAQNRQSLELQVVGNSASGD